MTLHQCSSDRATISTDEMRYGKDKPFVPFPENCGTGGKIVIPFFIYGSTAYLRQCIDKIHEVTPVSVHLRTETV